MHYHNPLRIVEECLVFLYYSTIVLPPISLVNYFNGKFVFTMILLQIAYLVARCLKHGTNNAKSWV